MYERSMNSALKHIDFILLDMFTLFAAFMAAYGIYNHAFLVLTSRSLYLDCLLIIEGIDLGIVLFTNSYKNILRRNAVSELLKTAAHVSLITAGLLIFLFFSKEIAALSRLTIGYFYLLAMVLLFLMRTLWKRLVCKQIQVAEKRRLLLVAGGNEVEALLQQISDRGVVNFEIKGIMLLNSGGLREIPDIPIVARSEEETIMYLSNHVIDGVLFAMGDDGSLPRQLMSRCETMGLTVHILLPMMDKLYGVQEVEKLVGIPAVSSSLRIVSKWDMAAKRLMDIMGGLVGTVLTGVVLMFVAPALYLSDPGPIFFKQTRIGQSGRPFTVYKIRSMYQDAETRKQALMDQNQMSGFMFKMDNDPRIIGSGPDGTRHGIGWFIRTFSLDEFPQFWCVLVGTMSLVGTRPPTMDEWEQYAPHHRARMRIKPGITGMWQVSGRSTITDFEEVVRLDTQYIQNWSLGLDIRILFKTVVVVFKREGSK